MVLRVAKKNESAFYLVCWGMSLIDLLGVGLAFVVPRLAANLFTLTIEQKVGRKP
jgi:hypothetical protein